MIDDKFTCKNGQTVSIKFDEEDDYRTLVADDEGNKIGEFTFRYDEDSGVLRLMRTYLDEQGSRWLEQGIGRYILSEVKDMSRLPIVAAAHDGQVRDDGSHLTAHAPAFVAKMRKARLIEETPF